MIDREKSKKIRNIRVIATNIFMCISVVAIVFVLMLIAMGFTFTESGKLEQAGLLKISSNPSNAEVKIDNANQFGHTEFSKMLSAGTHSIFISKDGYDSWSKELRIDAGLLTRIEWARLFPKNAISNSAATFKDLRLANFSANRKQLLILEKDSTRLALLDIQSDKIERKEISLSEILKTSDKKALKGELSLISWNEDNTKAIIKWTRGETISWHIANLAHPDKSINLSSTFNLAFDSILIANDHADKFWALENGNLHFINADNTTISGTIASNIVKIANNKSVVAFINTNDEKTEYYLNLFKEGENGSTEIKKLGKLKNSDSIRLAMGTYWSEEWLAYSTNKHFVVISGKYPSYNRNNSNPLEERLNLELDYTPQFASVNANQRIIVLAGEKKLTSFDIETKENCKTELTADITGINWLDDYLLWQNVDKAIIVRDFDGGNRRQIVANVDNHLPIIVNENNKYLYYFDLKEEENVEETASDADLNQNPTVTRKYILKRIKLD